MKKILFAVAVAAGWAGTAAAQSNVTVYGLLDTSMVRESGGTAGAVTKVTSGVGSGSRLGFKGSEDLGGGLSAIFLLESGFQLDTGASGQGGLLFGRQIYAGLQGGFGTVMVGRQYTPQYLTVVFADPFGSGWVGDTKNIMATTGNAFSRMDNTVKYVSPAFRGLTVELVAAPGEVSGDSAGGRQLGAAIDYTAGPLRVRFGYHDRNNDTVALKNTDNARNAVLAAVYDFGVARLHAAFGTNRGLNSSVLRNTANPFGRAIAPVASTDSHDALVGITVPLGTHALLASYLRKDDRTAFNQDASQVAIGYRYGLSKRTDLMIAHARIDNRNGAGYTVGSAIESGSGDRATSIGLRHAF
jgi:predicted porin